MPIYLFVVNEQVANLLLRSNMFEPPSEDNLNMQEELLQEKGEETYQILW